MKHYKLNGEIYNSLFSLKRALKNVSFPQNITDEMLIDLGVEIMLVDIVEPTLDELKTAKLAEIDTWTADKITGGFVSSCSGEPVRYDSDKDTQLTMQGIVLNVSTERFAKEYPLGCPVRGYKEGESEKTIQYLNPAQLYNWSADMSAHIGACKQQGWEKQAQVASALSKEELEAIQVEITNG